MSETRQPDPRVETERRRVLAGLAAAGIKPPASTASNTGDYLPHGVEWMTERVADSDPEGNKVVTDRGKAMACDFLILATGLALNCAGTEGMDTARIGQNGIGSICHSPQAAGRHRHLAGHVGVRRQGRSSLFSATSRKGYVAFSGYRHRFDRKWPLHRTIEPARLTTGAGRRRFIFDKSVKKTVSWTG